MLMAGRTPSPDGRVPETVVDRSWLARPALEVAPDLLGCVLARAAPEGVVAVRLTEVEAYEGLDDPGSHAFRGRTARTDVMFGPPGHLYVYFSYGMHWCANLVCREDGRASAVLLRAGEVVEGLEIARARRPSARDDRQLARGPARLARTLGLTGADNGADVVGPGTDLWLARPAVGPPADQVRSGPRVGLARAADRPWRFWLDGEPTVSAYRRHTRTRRA